MTEVSQLLIDIVWKSTQIFFILSFFIFFIFFIIKKILFYTNNSIQTKNIIYDNFQNIQPNTANRLDLLAYSNSMGVRLLKSQTSDKKNKLKEEILKKELYTSIVKHYNNSHFSIEYLYYLNTIVLLQDEESRLLYHKILSKGNYDIAEFNILALHGLALIASTANDILTLHHYLTKSYENYWTSQKLATYFFIIALKNLNTVETINTLGRIPANSYMTYAFIYALKSIIPTQKMKEVLLHIQDENSQNDTLLITILRTFYAWKTYVPELILANYKHENVLMRVVCSKIGLDLVGKQSSYKLLIYLIDDSQHVRNNFMESLQRHQFKKEEIISDLKKYYPNYHVNTQLMEFLKYYRVDPKHD